MKKLLVMLIVALLAPWGLFQEPAPVQAKPEPVQVAQKTVEIPLTPLLEAAPASTRILSCTQGTVSVLEYETEEEAQRSLHRDYTLYNQDRVSMGRLEAKTDLQGSRVEEIPLPSQSGTLRYYDAVEKKWKEQPLKIGEIRASCIDVTLDGGEEYMIYTPKTYEPLGDGSLRYLPEQDGRIKIISVGGELTLRVLTGAVPAGYEADFMFLYSPEGCLEWEKKNIPIFWGPYSLDGEGKWCFDGYYWPAPEGYIPGGENVLYRMPAAYLCKSFAYGAEQVRAAEDLAIATLDTMSLQQNVFGFFPTLSQNTLLTDGYEIGKGFYDTRFNTDLAEIYYRTTRWTQCQEFDQTMEEYFSFFLTYAKNYHRETANGGWLVEDYWDPLGGKTTHTSLNHQAAEILTLYHYADYWQRQDLRELGDKMLLAIEDTAKQWIGEDGNLYYACLADETYGGPDYPYLTYNDLFYLQAYLKEKGREVPALQTLMDAKKAWMDANGITGYLK